MRRRWLAGVLAVVSGWALGVGLMGVAAVYAPEILVSLDEPSTVVEAGRTRIHSGGHDGRYPRMRRDAFRQKGSPNNRMGGEVGEGPVLVEPMVEVEPSRQLDG